MTFKRSEAGLSNQHQFYGVQVVVFVEGGQRSPSMDELEAESIGSNGPDVAFWATILRHFRYSKTYKITAVGSKLTLREVAQAVAEGRIRNVVVAMDRDFDNLTGDIPAHPSVLYTYGYSWENEAWHPIVVLTMLSMLCPEHPLTDAIRSETQRCFERFRRSLRRLVTYEAAMAIARRERGALKKPDTLLEQTKAWPRCRRSAVAQATVKYARVHKNGGGTPALLPTIDVSRDCCGKMIAAFSYRLLRRLIRAVGGSPSISKELASGLAVSCFATVIGHADMSSIATHYAQLVEAAN